MPDQTSSTRAGLIASWDEEPASAPEFTPEQEAENIRAVLATRAPADFNPTPTEYKELYGKAMPRPKAQPKSAAPTPIRNAPRTQRKPGQRLTEEQIKFALEAPGNLNQKAVALGVPRQTLQSLVNRAKEIESGVNMTHHCRRCKTLLVCPTCGGEHE